MLSMLAEYQFLRYALIAGLLTSVVCGIIGVIIVEKKLVMLTGGIAHTAYGGVGLGYFFGFEPILGALAVSVAASCSIGAVKRHTGSAADVIIAMMWSAGMAMGILLIALMPGYPPDLNSYLFGNILSVTRTELITEAIVCAAVCLVVFIFYNDWKAYLFDSEFSAILGLRVTVLEYTLLVMTALTVVVLIRTVGIILILALLTAPAAAASMVSKKMSTRMIISVVLGAIYCTAGLAASYAFNIPSGAAIILLSVAVYFAVYAATRGKRANMCKIDNK